ncbi:MAG: hypothetical protein RMK99_08920 [Anaerolineales bacterium]|nr:hypothetical protein [Anaerolineales bacterium]
MKDKERVLSVLRTLKPETNIALSVRRKDDGCISIFRLGPHPERPVAD